MRSAVTVLVLAASLCVTQAANYSGAAVKNPTGKPLGLIDVNGDDGHKLATIFIVGKEMAFDDKQAPIKGAGRIVAEPGKKFNLLVAAYPTDASGHDQIQEFMLHLAQIEWGEEGKVTDVRGLAPTIQDWRGREFTITSDTGKPTVKDGLLHLMLKGYGGEVTIRLNYGGWGIPGASNGGRVMEGAKAFLAAPKK